MAGSTGGDAAKQSVKLINNLQDISFWEIGLVIACTWAAIWLIRKTVPFPGGTGTEPLAVVCLGRGCRSRDCCC